MGIRNTETTRYSRLFVGGVVALCWSTSYLPHYNHPLTTHAFVTNIPPLAAATRRQHPSIPLSRTVTSATPIVLSSSSTDRSSGDNRTTNKRPPNNGNKKRTKYNKQNRPKPRSKAKQDPNMLYQKKKNRPQRPPPLLVDYETNMSESEQRARTMDNTILETCPHFAQCPGCSVGQDVTEIATIQSARRYFAKERYDGTFAATMGGSHGSNSFRTLLPSPTTHWRTQAKLVASNKSESSWMNEGCTFGLYQRNSHTVLPIPECVVHHPSINRAIQFLETATKAAKTSAYSESRREGDLRFVQLQVERTTGKVCLTLVWNASSLKACHPALSRLLKHLQQDEKDAPIFHSIWCHCNDGMGNNIFSRNPGRWHRLLGPEYLREPMVVPAQDSTDALQQQSVGWLYFTPLNFRQGNLDGFDILSLDVAKAIPGQSKVCELYGGVGGLGLTALAYHHYSRQPLQWLRCSDENPANSRCFQRAVDSLPSVMTGRSNSSYSHGRKNGQWNGTPNSSSRQEEGTEMTLAELAALMDSGENPSSIQDDSDSEVVKVTYKVSSAAQALLMGEALGASVLIVDPPRKGLEEEVLEELCKPFDPDQPYVESATLLTIPDDRVNWTNDIQTLIYISCGFDALARDCDRLLNSDAGWTLQSSTGYVLFPGSDQLETLAILKRK